MVQVKDYNISILGSILIAGQWYKGPNQPLGHVIRSIYLSQAPINNIHTYINLLSNKPRNLLQTITPLFTFNCLTIPICSCYLYRGLGQVRIISGPSTAAINLGRALGWARGRASTEVSGQKLSQGLDSTPTVRNYPILMIVFCFCLGWLYPKPVLDFRENFPWDEDKRHFEQEARNINPYPLQRLLYHNSINYSFPYTIIQPISTPPIP